MCNIIEADLCVIGAGSGGLSVAAGAAQMGASVVLIEKGKMGGDCLNYGCVPSKALLSAAHIMSEIKKGKELGINVEKVTVDYKKVWEHVHSVIQSIAPKDSVERFEGLGVKVIEGGAQFENEREVKVGKQIIRARRFVIATGSSPMVPPIPGLDKVSYHTNETIFDLKELPKDLLVIGGGPIGCELSQAFLRFGSKVCILSALPILDKDDPKLTQVIRVRLLEEGADIREEIRILNVAKGNAGYIIQIDDGGERKQIKGSHLLVAAGRTPNVNGLDLEKAGIEYTPQGIGVDKRLRTSNKRVFAIGDVVGPYQFTHFANYHAGVVLRNALFRLPATVNYDAIPWVTYTDPELAHVGLSEQQAKAKHADVRILEQSFEENDRAQAEREIDGRIKVLTTKRGRVLGATIVSRHAGELILPWCLMVSRKMKIGHMASLIAPYPTRGEISKIVAGSYFKPMLFSERTKWIVKMLNRLF